MKKKQVSNHVPNMTTKKETVIFRNRKTFSEGTCFCCEKIINNDFRRKISGYITDSGSKSRTLTDMKDGQLIYTEKVSPRIGADNRDKHYYLVVKHFEHTVVTKRSYKFFDIDVNSEERMDVSNVDYATEQIYVKGKLYQNSCLCPVTRHVIITNYYPNFTTKNRIINGKVKSEKIYTEVGDGKKKLEHFIVKGNSKILYKVQHLISNPIFPSKDISYGLSTKYAMRDGTSCKPRSVFHWYEKVPGEQKLRHGYVPWDDKHSSALKLIIPMWRLYVHKMKRKRQALYDSTPLCKDVIRVITSF